MELPVVKVRVDGASGTIILNRPESRNALTREMLAEIQQALQDLYQERRVRAVILTGNGPSFCAGLDLHEMHETAQKDSPEMQWYEDALNYRSLIQTMLQYPKPIIASVNGSTVGGGTGLVLASDIVIAAESARFAVSAPRRGLVAGMVAPLLEFRIGGGHAALLLLTSREIDSQTACRMGIFHEVVAEDLVWARAQQVAEECAACAHEAVALTKRMLNETIGEYLTTMLATGAAVTATAKTTEAALEGIQAFVEKRQPRWP